VLALFAPTMPAPTPLSLTLNTPSGSSEVTFEFDLSSGVQAEMHESLASGTFYEPETTMLLLSVLRPGDRFVDVGGHVGYFSVIGSKAVGVTGEVVTFEPAPSNYRRLLHHLDINRCTNVLPLHMAVGAHEECVTLHLNSDNDGGHALWDIRSHPLNARSRETPKQYDIWMTRMSRILGDRPVRAMKLDIEGSELGALRGAIPLLAGDHGIPFVIAEINSTALEALGGSEDELRAFMNDLGYDTWLLQLEEPQLVKMEPGVTVQGNFVFNVLFWKRGVPLP